jgi:probable HAF family extracellular repeat protein
MKTRSCNLILVNMLFALAITASVLAQGQDQSAGETSQRGAVKKHHHYKLIDVGALGGPASGLFDSQKELTPNGTLVGWADTAIPNPDPNCFNFNFSPDCMIQHGFQFKEGVMNDLGALPGINNSQAEATNEHGLIVGQSENGLTDPYLNIPATSVVVWAKGKISDLGTLGGYQGIAFDVNNAGQVTGMATNTIPDQFSILGGTQSRAFLWEDGTLRDLGTLGGPDSFGQFINNRGQVAGFSYTSPTPGPSGFVPADPFIWDKKNGMRDLGNFGGAQVNPFRLNNRGELVGVLSLAGEQEYHPFLWNGEKLIDLGNLSGSYGEAHWINEAGDVVGLSFLSDGEVRAVLWAHENPKIKDLGTLEGDNCSNAWATNEKGQIVGFSSAQEIGATATGSCFDNMSTVTAIRATIWENGTIADLNDLVPAGSGLHLVIAKAINDRGEIAGVGTPPGVPLNNNNNEAQGHDFILIPCDEDHPDVDGCNYSMVDSTGEPDTRTDFVHEDASAASATGPVISHIGVNLCAVFVACGGGVHFLITASVTSAAPIAKVQFVMDGRVSETETHYPYEAIFGFTRLQNVFTVTATDVDGHTGTKSAYCVRTTCTEH